MAIYLDPSECGPNSRLPDSVIKAGIQIAGLEHYTGADMLLTTLDQPKLKTITDSKPSQLALRKALDHGMLVQRKTTDLIASTPELSYALNKMLESAPKFGAWLLSVSDICVNKDDKIVINGSEAKGGVNADSVMLVPRKWQLRGGYYEHLKYDREITMWVRQCLAFMETVEQHPVKVLEPRKPVQVITDQQLDKPWRSTLASIPGVGIKRATAIADYCGTLANSLAYLSDTSNLITLPNKPEGVGIKTFTEVQRWLGIQPDEIMVVGPRAMFEGKDEDSEPIILVDSDGEPVALPFSVTISASAGDTPW
jgi:hypothetical protein